MSRAYTVETFRGIRVVSDESGEVVAGFQSGAAGDEAYQAFAHGLVRVEGASLKNDEGEYFVGDLDQLDQ